ncbi:MAG TPA: hypothetical protein PKN75_10550 [Bacteroidia bacterium]|nr:hypothetical protein [Bacteroidia bacterium]HNU34018.1 hypothetical protein [Bacteroidia bacterium]
MWKALLINFAVLLLLLLCFEIVLRATGIGFDSAAFVPDKILHHAHKKNYTFINDNPAASEYSDIVISYDSEGRVTNHDVNQRIDTTKAKLKIALLGDSFTEAVQVSFSESFTGLLQKRFADTVAFFNYGVGEYSPVFYYLQAINSFKNQRFNYAIILLYSNDVRDDSVYYAKANKDATGNVVAISGEENSRLAQFARKSYLLRLIRKYYIRFVYWKDHRNKPEEKTVGGFIEESPVLSPLTKKLIQQTDSVLALRGTQLVLSAVPSKYKLINHIPHDSTDFANKVKSYAIEMNYHYIDLVQAFEIKSQTSLLFFHKDIHFNKNGHEVVAQQFQEYIYKTAYW